MRKQTDLLHHMLLGSAMLALLGLTACGPAATPAPTLSVNAIYTAAAQTFTAQQATLQASIPATAIPSQTAVPSPVPTTAAGGSGLPVTGGTAIPQCNNSLYVNDVTIPDGTVMAPSTPFTKTWTIKNTGTCAWTTDYKLIFINGEAMGGTSVPLSSPVAPGAQTQISVNLTSPVLPGNYTGGWQLEDPQGNRFGEMITVVIVVSGAGGTSVTATP